MADAPTPHVMAVKHIGLIVMVRKIPHFLRKRWGLDDDLLRSEKAEAHAHLDRLRDEQ